MLNQLEFYWESYEIHFVLVPFLSSSCSPPSSIGKELECLRMRKMGSPKRKICWQPLIRPWLMLLQPISWGYKLKIYFFKSYMIASASHFLFDFAWFSKQETLFKTLQNFHCLIYNVVLDKKSLTKTPNMKGDSDSFWLIILHNGLIST